MISDRRFSILGSILQHHHLEDLFGERGIGLVAMRELVEVTCLSVVAHNREDWVRGIRLDEDEITVPQMVHVGVELTLSQQLSHCRRGADGVDADAWVRFKEAPLHLLEVFNMGQVRRPE